MFSDLDLGLTFRLKFVAKKYFPKPPVRGIKFFVIFTIYMTSLCFESALIFMIFRLKNALFLMEPSAIDLEPVAFPTLVKLLNSLHSTTRSVLRILFFFDHKMKGAFL